MPGSAGFFTRRWRGEVPMRVLFWRDMVTVGTVFNLLATAVALAIALADEAIVLAAVVHFAPLPYNLFLVASVWRWPGVGAYRWASVAWLVVVTLV